MKPTQSPTANNELGVTFINVAKEAGLNAKCVPEEQSGERCKDAISEFGHFDAERAIQEFDIDCTAAGKKIRDHA